jgi:hypothetical protein
VGQALRGPTKHFLANWWDCAKLVPPYFSINANLAISEDQGELVHRYAKA